MGFHNFFKSDLVRVYDLFQAYGRNTGILISSQYHVSEKLKTFLQNDKVFIMLIRNDEFWSESRNNNSLLYHLQQDEPILEQLIHGARYLDFRIGRYSPVKSLMDLIISPDGSEFWLNHDFVRVNKLVTALDDVKMFLNNTQEIVIIDIHAFPVGFKKRSKSHVELIGFLKSQLSDHLVSYMGYNSTLEEISKTGKRLILVYNKPSIVHMHYSSLWRSVSQRWGDVRTVQDLHIYLNSSYSRPFTGGMSAVMAELTPNTWDVVTDEHQGLRRMMDACNHNVTEWFRGNWGRSANVVAVDFIRSTGIVSAAIKWNREKASSSRKDGISF